ncbi:MAG: hypothetical protein AAF219_06410, partial [Myxococcota bacterium]
QQPRMIAVGEETSCAPEECVESFREADVETLHAAGERTLRGRLDDDMDMITLHRVANDLKISLLRLSEAASNRFVGFLTPERQHIIEDFERHMHRGVPPELDATHVRHLG